MPTRGLPSGAVPQIGRLKEARAKRSATNVAQALDKLGKIADRLATQLDIRGAALVPAIVDATRARASVGEIASVLRSRWGAYRPGAV